MDYRDFEIQLNNLNKDIFDFFEKTEVEESKKIQDVFSILQSNIDDKSSLLESLEKQLENRESAYQKEIKNIREKIHQLEIETKTPLYNIDAKKQELESIMQEELKPFLVNQKKKKTDVTHRISNVKKELANIHRENNALLIEEEKNYKNRESELIRRLNIDLDRANDANIKQYSDIEKSLLEINDEKLINESQKKINSIRIVGLKEMTEIKNKYALAFFENDLEFKKFQEKIILENSIKSEEYKLKIKELEFEKTTLEDEEEKTIQMYKLENDKKLLQFDKENSIFLNQFNTERNNKIINFKYDSLTLSHKRNSYQVETLNIIQNETTDFDLMQAEEIKPLNDYIYSNLQEEVTYVTNGLITCINYFKGILYNSIEKAWYNKRNLHQDFIKYLLITLKENVNFSDYSYKELLASLQKDTDLYIKAQEHRFDKMKKAIDEITKNLLKQVSGYLKAVKEYQSEGISDEKDFFKRIKETLKRGNKESISLNENLYMKNNLKLLSDNESLKKEVREKDESSRVCNQKIAQKYEYELNQLEVKIKLSQSDFKLKEEKDKYNFRKFAKANKNKINQLKKTYTENVLKYERELFKQYKEALAENEEERRNHVSSL